MEQVRSFLGMSAPTPSQPDPARESIQHRLDDAELRLRLMDEQVDATVKSDRILDRRRAPR